MFRARMVSAAERRADSPGGIRLLVRKGLAELCRPGRRGGRRPKVSSRGHRMLGAPERLVLGLWSRLGSRPSTPARRPDRAHAHPRSPPTPRTPIRSGGTSCGAAARGRLGGPAARTREAPRAPSSPASRDTALSAGLLPSAVVSTQVVRQTAICCSVYPKCTWMLISRRKGGIRLFAGGGT